tara:strand:+ start:334 stop:492 length:159 start_codon:yes stop_codon:yes gene_type:complete
VIVNKILKNQIIKIVKEIVGLNDNKWELRKMQTEIRSLSAKVSRLQKKVEDA